MGDRELNEQINSAPKKLKDYIHDLVSGYGKSAEMVQDNICLKDTAESQAQEIAELKADNDRFRHMMDWSKVDLQAHINELRKGIRKITNFCDCGGTGAYGEHWSGCLIRRGRDLLSRTPRQSLAEHDAEKDKQIAVLVEALGKSEEWRLAYRKGKLKLYAMGGDIAEAVMSSLPCNEGPLERMVQDALADSRPLYDEMMARERGRVFAKVKERMVATCHSHSDEECSDCGMCLELERMAQESEVKNDCL